MPTAYRYTGQRLDAATGLYFYNARYYDPGLGRFTQPDTIVPNPGDPQSLNRYSYAGNNPLRYTDPTGHYIFEDDPKDVRFIVPPNRNETGQPVGIVHHDDIAETAPVTFAEMATVVTTPIWGSAVILGGIVAAEYTFSTSVSYMLARVARWVAPLYVNDGDCGNEIGEIKTGTTVVYRYVENGVTRYVGITNDFARRAGEHIRQRGWGIEKITGLDELSRYDARAVEQALIEYYQLSRHGGVLWNRINSIAASNPIYEEALKRGQEILETIGFFP